MMNINLYGGPGIGKSTIAAGLFYALKTRNYKVEYVQEYAKDLTYGRDEVKLSDQVHILGEQYHRMFRLKDQVDYIINDSPILLANLYADPENTPIEEFKELNLALYKKYEHVNILLERNLENHTYQRYGRKESMEEAIQKDNEIKEFLINNDIKFYGIKRSSVTISTILDILKESYDL